MFGRLSPIVVALFHLPTRFVPGFDVVSCPVGSAELYIGVLGNWRIAEKILPESELVPVFRP